MIDDHEPDQKARNLPLPTDLDHQYGRVIIGIGNATPPWSEVADKAGIDWNPDAYRVVDAQDRVAWHIDVDHLEHDDAAALLALGDGRDWRVYFNGESRFAPGHNVLVTFRRREGCCRR